MRMLSSGFSRSGEQLWSRMAIFLVLLMLLLCSLLPYVLEISRPSKLPPGPIPLPLIGNLAQLYIADRHYPFKAIAKLAKKYGDVLWLRVGSSNIVTLNGYNTIKSALCDTDDFLNRTDGVWILDRSFGKPQGLVSSRDEFWNLTKTFTLRHLKNFGYGSKYALQGFVNDELEVILGEFERAIQKKGGVLRPHSLFQYAVLNVVWAAVGGARFDHEDKRIQELMRLNNELVRNLRPTGGIVVLFPWLAKLLPRFFNLDEFIAVNRAHQNFLKDYVNLVRRKGTYRKNPQSFVEIFLQKIDSVEEKPSKDDHIFTEENLLSILYDFLGATDPANGTLVYACLWLVLHQDVQEKFYEEIVRVVGKDRLPVLTDQINLPYVRATIFEIHRRSTMAPLTPRKIYKDTEFQGFHIPKNTLVLVNYYSSQMDPDMWGDPENFRPERFLDPEGNIVNEHKLLTFSIGKRSCMGEAAAETAIFSFLTGIIQKYKLLPVKPGHKYETRPVLGIGLSPQPFEIRVERRSK